MASITRSRPGHQISHGPPQAGVAVDDAEQRGLQPPCDEAVQAPLPGFVGFAPTQVQLHQHLLPVGGGVKPENLTTP